MNCEEIKTLLAGYADNELSPIEKDAVGSHVEQCGRCRQIVLDQQRVHHVLNAYQPPPVSEESWNDIARHLKTEMTGKSDPAVLKTRTRVEGLDPTPASQAALRPDETALSARQAAPRPRLTTTVSSGPTPAILVPRLRKRRAAFGWVAHAVGALAACLVIGIGMAAFWTDRAPPIEPGNLAHQKDVVIMDFEVLDKSYSVALNAGDSDDVASVWLLPDEG
jgi:hypothetical protein